MKPMNVQSGLQSKEAVKSLDAMIPKRMQPGKWLPSASSKESNLEESGKLVAAVKVDKTFEKKQPTPRATKIQVDQNIVLWAWLIGVAVAFISSAIVSFNGITSVAVYVGLSGAWMASLFFFFVELMYLIFLLAYLVLESRAENSTGALVGMFAFAGIAVAANAFHTLDYWEWVYDDPRVWAGIVLSISAPIAIISSSKMASRVVFSKAGVDDVPANI
jgi:hypothetical protein